MKRYFFLALLALSLAIPRLRAQCPEIPPSILICAEYPVPIRLPQDVATWLDSLLLAPPPPGGGGGDCKLRICWKLDDILLPPPPGFCALGLPWLPSEPLGVSIIIPCPPGSSTPGKALMQCAVTAKQWALPAGHCFSAAGPGASIECAEVGLGVCWDDDGDGTCTWSDPDEDLDDVIARELIDAGNDPAAIMRVLDLNDPDQDDVPNLWDVTPNGWLTGPGGTPIPNGVNPNGLMPRMSDIRDAMFHHLFPGVLPKGKNVSDYVSPSSANQDDLAQPSGVYTLADLLLDVQSNFSTNLQSLQSELAMWSMGTIHLTTVLELIKDIGAMRDILVAAWSAVHDDPEGAESRMRMIDEINRLNDQVQTIGQNIIGLVHKITSELKAAIAGVKGVNLNTPAGMALSAQIDAVAHALNGCGNAFWDLIIDKSGNFGLRITLMKEDGTTLESQELFPENINRLVQSSMGDPVDVASGQFIYDVTDVSIPGRGLDLVIERRYESRRHSRGIVGSNWSMPLLESRLIINSQTDLLFVRMEGADGRTSYFAEKDLPGGEKIWLGVEGEFGKLQLDRWPAKDRCSTPGFLVYRSPKGIQYRFGMPISYYGAGGALVCHLMEVSDSFGNAIILHRNEDGRVHRIDDSLRRSYELVYDGFGLLTEITGPEGLQITYTYDTENFGDATRPLRKFDLIKVERSPTIYVNSKDVLTTDRPFEAYEYDEVDIGFALAPYSPSNHNLLSVTRGIVGPALVIDYGTLSSDPTSFDRVVSHTIDGSTTHFRYVDLSGSMNPDPYGQQITQQTEMRNADGDLVRYSLDEKGILRREESFLYRDANADWIPDDPPSANWYARVTLREYDSEYRLIEERTTTDTEYLANVWLETEWVYDVSNVDRFQQSNIIEHRTYPRSTTYNEATQIVRTFVHDPVTTEVSESTDALGRISRTWFGHREMSLSQASTAFGIAGWEIALSTTTWALSDLNGDAAVPTETLGGLLFGPVGLVYRRDAPDVSEQAAPGVTPVVRTPHEVLEYNLRGQPTASRIDGFPRHERNYCHGYVRTSEFVISGETTTTTHEVRASDGVLLSTLHPDGRMDLFRYDGNKLPIETRARSNVAGEDDVVTQIYRDLEGHAIGSVGPFFEAQNLDTYGSSLASRWSQRNEITPAGRLASSTAYVHYDGSTSSATTTYDYDAEGRIATSMLPNGGSRHTMRDPRGLVIRLEARDSNSAVIEGSTYTYDGLGIPTAVVSDVNSDGIGSSDTTTYLHDGYLRNRGVIADDGTSTWTVLDAENRVIENLTSSALGQVLTHRVTTFDALDRPIITTDANNGIAADGTTFAVLPTSIQSRFGYGPHGELWRDNPAASSEIVRSKYDAAGRPESRWLGMTDELGESVERDVFGRVLLHNRFQDRTGVGGSTVEQSTMTFAFDSRGRLAGRSEWDGVMTEFKYDAFGGIRKEERLDRVVETERDSAGKVRLVEQSGPSLARVTRYDRDALGQLTSQTDPEGRITTFNYDDLHRPASKLYHDGLGDTYCYDASGRIVSIAKPGNVTWNYTFDGRGRVRTVSAVGGDAPATKTYEYDPLGRPSLRTDQVGSLSAVAIQQRWTSLGALVDDELLVGGATRGIHTFTHDSRLRIAGHSYPSGLEIARTFDGVGRPDTIVADPTGNNPILVSDVLENLGTFGATKIAIAGGGSIDRAFDAEGRMTRSEAINGMTSLPYWGATYTFDDYGNLDSRTESVGNHDETMAYDDFDRLSSWTTSTGRTLTWSHDDVDNWLARTDSAAMPNSVQPQVNDLNQYTEFAPFGIVAHTSRGDEWGRLAGDLLVIWSRDAFGRPFALSVYFQAIPILQIDYVHDALDRMIEKRVSGVSTERYRFVESLMTEVEVNGSTIEHVAGPQGIWRRHANGAWDHLFVDPFLNVTAVHDGNSVVEGYRYDPYGAPRSASSGAILSGTNANNRLLFLGKPYDFITGLYKIGVRIFDPSFGRFLERDPAGESAGLALYNYHGQNPYRWVDPSGFGPEAVKAGDELPRNNGLTIDYGNGNTIHFPGFTDNGPYALRNALSSGADFITSSLDVLAGNGFDGFTFDSLSYAEKLEVIDRALEHDLTTDDFAVYMRAVRNNLVIEQQLTGLLDGFQLSLDGLSLALDGTGVGGAFSWIPDLLNAGTSALRGDWTGAGLSAVAAIPFAGAAANLARVGRRAEVILDTNAVIRFAEASKLLKSGDTPVITNQVIKELDDLVARGSIDGIPNVVKQLDVVDDVVDIGTQGALRQALGMESLGSAWKTVDLNSVVGLAGDAIIGTTALLTGRSVITADGAFAAALTRLGGVAKLLR